MLVEESFYPKTKGVSKAYRLFRWVKPQLSPSPYCPYSGTVYGWTFEGLVLFLLYQDCLSLSSPSLCSVDFSMSFSLLHFPTKALSLQIHSVILPQLSSTVSVLINVKPSLKRFMCMNWCCSVQDSWLVPSFRSLLWPMTWFLNTFLACLSSSCDYLIQADVIVAKKGRSNTSQASEHLHPPWLWCPSFALKLVTWWFCWPIMFFLWLGNYGKVLLLSDKKSDWIGKRDDICWILYIAVDN